MGSEKWKVSTLIDDGASTSCTPSIFSNKSISLTTHLTNQYQNHVESIIIHQLTYRKKTGSRFTNLEALRQNDAILQVLYLAKNGQNSLLSLYIKAQKQAEDIIERIEAEIG
ncbi:MAG: hypothetical protein DHS20C18_31460 [Saprospiraceae bacterium]|nr:MAG: hypothetical protein DHS20C18_31460 [Saprospiraceae bacterium]